MKNFSLYYLFSQLKNILSTIQVQTIIFLLYILHFEI